MQSCILLPRSDMTFSSLRAVLLKYLECRHSVRIQRDRDLASAVNLCKIEKTFF